MPSISERAIAGRRQRPQPVYFARAKVGNGWTTIGAVWRFRSGEEGFSVQLQALPLNWDGRFVLLPPLEDGSEPDPGDMREEEFGGR